jgi:hypothetical protein
LAYLKMVDDEAIAEGFFIVAGMALNAAMAANLE